MQGEGAASDLRASSGGATPARLRLFACFALAVAAHVATLALQPPRTRPVALRRSAGGSQQIELEDCAPELPHLPPVLAATLPVALAVPRHREMSVATRA